MVKPAGLVLFHGAGGNRDHRHFLALEAALDIPVRRVNFAYRDLGARRPPPRAPKLIEELNEIVPAIADELGTEPKRLLLGGRSMGGRMASMAVAEGLPARGLILLSYPLHPPGKPDRLRVDHFPQLRKPCLFVSGDRDPFGLPGEWDDHLGTIPGAVDFHWLAGDAHDPKKNDDELVDLVARWVRARR
ncbi:MAG: alpha/beta fold hydrolase [Actinomycetota bacterium]